MNEREEVHEGSDAAFVARITAPLRASETLDASFEERLASAIRRDVEPRGAGMRQSGSRLAWLTRKRTFRISPIAGLALAAGVAAIAALGSVSLLALRESRPTLGATPAIDGVHVVHMVRFVFVDSSARSVSLVGDFNGWNRDAQDLRRAENGSWSISIPLAPGRHEYAFIVDGKRWVTDPFATSIHDDFGTESSVIQLGHDTLPSTT